MKIMIVDDDALYANKLKKDLFVFFCTFYDKIDIKTVNKNFHKLNLDDDYDFVFLDIDLLEINGFHLAEKVKTVNSKCKIVFISALSNLVYASLLIQPFFFIRKSHYKKDIQNLFLLIKKQQKNNDSIMLNYNRNRSHVLTNQIIYIEARQHVLLVYTKNDTLYDNRSLKQMLSVLENQGFVQIYKSYIINLNYLLSYKKNSYVLMQNNIKLTIGRKFKDNFEIKYKEFLIS